MVLRIVNNRPQALSGNVVFSAPENWTIYTFGNSRLTIPAGDSAFIPLRIYIPGNVIGGLHYVLTGAFHEDRETHYTTAYFHIVKKSNWSVNMRESNIFFNVYQEETDLEIQLNNKGNVYEIIRLDFDVGRLYVINKMEQAKQVRYINLPPVKDTLIRIPVKYNNSLKFGQVEQYQNNWKESTINIRASTFDQERNLQVRLNQLNSEFNNVRLQRTSPLNLELQGYNLLSAVPTKLNTRVFGNILFKNQRDLNYLIALNNLYFEGDDHSNFDFYRQFQFDINYQDPRLSVRARNNNYGGDIHYISGWGVNTSYQVNPRNTAYFSLMQHPIALYRGVSAGWDIQLGSVKLRTGLTYEDHPSQDYRGIYILMGSHFILKQRHSLGIDLVGSSAYYRDPRFVSAPDTSVLGISYRFSYQYRSEKFIFRINNLNTVPSSTRNSGRIRLDVDSKYIVNPGFRFDLYYSGNYFKAVRYPYAFFYPANFDMNDFGRLFAIITNSKVVYQFGPIYNSVVRNFYDRVTGYTSIYRSYYPGIRGSVSFRLDDQRRITPSATLYNLIFRGSSDDPGFGLKNYNALHYDVGINYYDQIWRVTAIYQSGTSTDLFRSVQLDETPQANQSIQIRPSFEKFLLKNVIRLAGYASYLYYMPSGRENLIFNLRGDFYLPQGWLLYLSGNMYMNSRRDVEFGRSSTKDVNVFAGIRKSFDIQQPRLKYFDYRGVFFNDLNGNGLWEPAEPPVPNIMVNISRDQGVSEQKTNFIEVTLITDTEGHIKYTNLPEGNYNLTFLPLGNLQDLYFVNGPQQRINISSDAVHSVPLAESYKIRGRIILDRDPNSSEGKISLEGIKVTATGPGGQTYSVLTDAFGFYILHIPQALTYKVTVSNVLGENFLPELDRYEVRFDHMKSINLDVKFIEKRREIRIREGEEFYEFRDLVPDTIPRNPLPAPFPVPYPV
jgi:hypothetical protein